MPIDPRDLPGFMPSETLPSSPLQHLPQGLPIGGQGLPPGAGEPSGFERFTEIMKTVLPLIAAAGAYRQGSLGSFTGGMLDVRQQQDAFAADEEDRRFRQDQYQQEVDYRRSRDEASAADAQARADRQARIDQQQEESRLRQVLKDTIAPLGKNKIYADGITVEEASGQTINVPGVGPVSLLEALRTVGVAQDERGTYLPFAPLDEEEPNLVPTPAPGGPVWGPQVKGAPVYERPREGRAPSEPKKPSVKVRRDPEGVNVVEYTDPERGVSQEFSADEIEALLQADGRPSDPTTVDRVMRSPEALGELLR